MIVSIVKDITNTDGSKTIRVSRKFRVSLVPRVGERIWLTPSPHDVGDPVIEPVSAVVHPVARDGDGLPPIVFLEPRVTGMNDGLMEIIASNYERFGFVVVDGPGVRTDVGSIPIDGTM